MQVHEPRSGPPAEVGGYTPPKSPTGPNPTGECSQDHIHKAQLSPPGHVPFMHKLDCRLTQALPGGWVHVKVGT